MDASPERQCVGTRRVAILLTALTFALTACVVDLDESTVGGASELEAAIAALAQPNVNDGGDPNAQASEESAAPADDAQPAEQSGIDGLPVLGPVPGRSHWHAAYVVRVCDQVLDPFEETASGIGIHSHADALVHIHPSSPEAGFENATLQTFAEAVGFGISDGELTLPSGVIWRDGDNCAASRGRVFVDRWPGPGVEGPPERIFEDLASIRFEADREVYQIAFAPEDSAPVVPPSVAQLEEVSAPIVVDDVWVDVDANPDLSTVKLWAVQSVAEPPCADDAVVERTRAGTPTCFVSIDEQFDRTRAISAARAVSFNRRAAVELTITEEFRSYLARRLRTAESAAVAIELGGEVIYAIRYDADALADDLLIIRGGLDADTARALARLFAI